ncbi:MAG TPA: hypothetical protein VER17_04585 [Tepidisphaeraceae bacterium]|nr:hypothetical protein [Tepidisphaeraceae bacterium]
MRSQADPAGGVDGGANGGAEGGGGIAGADESLRPRPRLLSWRKKLTCAVTSPAQAK